jgi:putative membrane protein
MAQMGQPPGGQMPTPNPQAPGGNPGINPGMNTPGYGATPTTPQQFDDKKFLKDQVISALTEIELGKLAAQKASNNSVKEFGQRMVDDYTKTNDQLKQLASTMNVSVPSELTPKQQSQIEKLSKLSGPAFDKAYIKDEVKNHERDVREAQDEMQGGTIANVKQLASNMLPSLQSHASAAKSLSKEIKK